MDNKVSIREVGPRDGLQMVTSILTTEQKLEWCRRSVAAGLNEIEITSFVPAKIVPQFSDAEEVALGAEKIAGLTGAALVPNLRGAERALKFNLNKVNYVLSASETHNLKNVRRSTDESIEDFGRIVQHRNKMSEFQTKIGGGISTAFGCTMEGCIPEFQVLRIVEQLLELGAEEIIIADTVGYANPRQVKSLLRKILQETGDIPVACHFHDTHGLGLANVSAAIDVGVRSFDASLAGLGGCPFAPNATGNINTEDCIYLLESMGFKTGVDIEAILGLRKKIESWLPEEAFSGAIARAGLPKNFQYVA